MAFMNLDKKKALAPGIKAVLKKYGVRGTIAMRHYSTLIVNIWESEIDFELNGGTYESVNTFHIVNNHSGVAAEFLSELNDAMNVGNHDNSDVMTDYFDVGWYTNINIGKWNKPYKLKA